MPMPSLPPSNFGRGNMAKHEGKNPTTVRKILNMPKLPKTAMLFIEGIGISQSDENPKKSVNNDALIGLSKETNTPFATSSLFKYCLLNSKYLCINWIEWLMVTIKIRKGMSTVNGFNE